MKKRLLSFLLLLLLLIPAAGLFALWKFEGVTPAEAPSGFDLVTGLGAKLACSGRYLSGFDEGRIVDDVASYSAVTRLLGYRELPGRAVEARLLGLSPAVARYRPGLGCTLEYAGGAPLDAVEVPPQNPPAHAPWPAGGAAGEREPAVQARIEELLAADNAAGLETRALLVVQDGRILAEAYAPGITRDTPLLGWSMGKSVIAIMLGRLERLGRVSVDERNLFPAWAGDERAAISLENLLHMTSGLAFEEDYVPGSDSTRMLFMSPSAARVAMASPLAHPPGSRFHYSSGTTNLLSLLVHERVGGSTQALVDFFHTEIAVPLGLENTVLEPDASGVFVGSSFVYATARDWARFGQLMVDDGVINGHRVLSADWVERAAAPNESEIDRRYGYQFWLNRPDPAWWPSLPRDAYAMQGNRRQVVMILPAQRAVIVRLGWSPGDYPIDRNFRYMLDLLPPVAVSPAG